MVKEFASHNNTAQIKRLLKILGQDFAVSKNPHSRKGGLIGLAAMAVGLGKVRSFLLPLIVSPFFLFLKIQSQISTFVWYKAVPKNRELACSKKTITNIRMLVSVTCSLFYWTSNEPSISLFG